MRAVVDWSHDLLGGPERALLRRLAVFAGGWTLDAAEAVCADEGLPAVEVVDLLSRLVDRSLVVADHDAAGGVRYRFLETLRDYARERLDEADEDATVRDRHLFWCVGLAESSEPGLWGGAEQRTLRLLEAEHGNLRAALAWALGSTDGGGAGPVDRRGAGLRLAAALSRFWRSAAHHHEGVRWLEQALARTPAQHTARAAAPVAPAPVVASPAPIAAPIEGYAVEGPQGYEWRARSAMDGYAIVEGPFGYEVIGRDAASAPAIGGLVAVRVSSRDVAGATFRLLAPEDGYYDEGPQGYEWRLRPGR